MALSEMQIKNILTQLGVSEDQITKELIEEIQMNCKNSVEVISYVGEKGLVVTSRSGRGGGKTNTIEGILIAASNEPRLDTLFDDVTKKPLLFKDQRFVRYIPEEDVYVMVDEHGNFIIDENENVRTVSVVKQYVGYLLVNDKVMLLKSNKPLPTKPCYVKLNGRQYNNVFIVFDVVEERELSEIELDKLNDFIDNEVLKAMDKLNKECKNEILVFIGRVYWSGNDRKDETQPDRGELDLKTVFRVGHGKSAISISAYGVALPREAGIYIGLLNVRKFTRKDGGVVLVRTILHPVKLQR